MRRRPVKLFGKFIKVFKLWRVTLRHGERLLASFWACASLLGIISLEADLRRTFHRCAFSKHGTQTGKLTAHHWAFHDRLVSKQENAGASSSVSSVRQGLEAWKALKEYIVSSLIQISAFKIDPIWYVQRIWWICRVIRARFRCQGALWHANILQWNSRRHGLAVCERIDDLYRPGCFCNPSRTFLSAFANQFETFVLVGVLSGRQTTCHGSGRGEWSGTTSYTVAWTPKMDPRTKLQAFAQIIQPFLQKGTSVWHNKNGYYWAKCPDVPSVFSGKPAARSVRRTCGMEGSSQWTVRRTCHAYSAGVLKNNRHQFNVISWFMRIYVNFILLHALGNRESCFLWPEDKVHQRSPLRYFLSKVMHRANDLNVLLPVMELPWIVFFRFKDTSAMQLCQAISPWMFLEWPMRPCLVSLMFDWRPSWADSS